MDQNRYDVDSFIKWTFRNHKENLGSILSTTIVNTSVHEGTGSLGFSDTKTNNTNVSRNMQVPTFTYKKTFTLTLLSSKEFSFGEEISVEFAQEAGVTGVAKTSLKAAFKLTAGQKFTDTKTEINTHEQSITLGGGSVMVEPGETIYLKVAVDEASFTAKAINLREIKSLKNGVEPKQSYFVSGNMTTSSKEVNSYVPYDNPYDAFKLADFSVKHSGDDPAFEIMYQYDGHYDYYHMTYDEFSNHFYLDHENRKLYLIEETTLVSGVLGLRVHEELTHNPNYFRQ